ncbi:HNH endonuclease [Sphingopyxis sp. BSN-002]|uniref:HNH endonuclease n=1 Tax=Sphingopyxis sp. BSN-002 TaxID=2911495 RepID=UPI001EDA9EFB|nr:HNH endonuclease [Sphingopyxis sp. BSN-002]QVJ07678.1 zinc-binding loop region of homing endonuclease [Sphingopyxis phage VSN-002]UKK84779.1 HNH endonuclease [Sphingopyxis sp. BSN-002]
MTAPVTIPILPFLEGRKGQLILMRFWSKVDMRGPDECWDWQASLNKAGYGRFKIGSFINVTAHRVALVAHSLTDPPGKFALHSCDRPECVNPHHLRWGTVQENSDDMRRRGRSNNGEQEGFQNGACKLTEDQFALVIAGLQGGLNNKQIAEGLPVDHALVSRIRRGRSWAKQAAALGWVPQEKYASLTTRISRPTPETRNA